MSNFEILTLLIACLAALVSLYTLREQRKLQKESNELQRVTADLATRQIAQLEQQEAERLKARLAVDMLQEGAGHRLRISNVGNCDALSVELELGFSKGASSPLVKEEYEQKFPVKRINPGSWVTLSCAIYVDSPPSLDGTVSWSNPDGTRSSEEFTVFVS